MITELLQRQIKAVIDATYENTESFLACFFSETARFLGDEYTIGVSLSDEYVYVQLSWYDEDSGSQMVYDNTVDYKDFNDWYTGATSEPN